MSATTTALHGSVFTAKIDVLIAMFYVTITDADIRNPVKSLHIFLKKYLYRMSLKFKTSLY